ncbi:MAG: glycosyltransferase family 2 protein, partial [Chloroflexota bacterium]|nr:glycosyltransferase family 2 protein [Chloroflexota bacterium]
MGMIASLRAVAGSVLITHDLPEEHVADLQVPAETQVLPIASAEGVANSADIVVLAVPDWLALRRAISALPGLGLTKMVGCWLTEGGAGRAPLLVPRSEWPPIVGVTVESGESAWAIARFERPAPARSVLIEFARCSTNQRVLTSGWPLLASPFSEPHLWPPADPAAAIFQERPPVTDEAGPPDLIILGAGNRSARPVQLEQSKLHPVTGREPIAVISGPELSWEQSNALSTGDLLSHLEQTWPHSLGFLDENVINPIGFRRTSTTGMATLCPDRHRPQNVTLQSENSELTVDTLRGIAGNDLTFLRTVQGVSVDWTGGYGPQAYCRLVASLAMAGVPLQASHPPGWARQLLSGPLADALAVAADLDDPLAREEKSIELRRAALSSHASRSVKRKLAQRMGAQTSNPGSVSIILCTRRPDRLEFALRQILRQRQADIELIVATHGFEIEAARIDSLRGSVDVPLTFLSAGEDVCFGDVLNLAAQRTSGDVLLKMDDDDWYGPDFVRDLQLARIYSSADVVGCPSEFTFIEQLWATIRTQYETEQFRTFIAGGTIAIDRSVFQEVGGFRSLRRHVDASLLSAVRDGGGAIYRMHGLGYVLSRSLAGHTWDPGVGHFLAASRVSQQWRGFGGSRLLEIDPVDV